MTDAEKKIYDLERRIMEERQELNNLSQELSGSNKDALKDKLDFLKCEIVHIQRQCNMIEKEIAIPVAKPVSSSSSWTRPTRSPSSWIPRSTSPVQNNVQTSMPAAPVQNSVQTPMPAAPVQNNIQTPMPEVAQNNVQRPMPEVVPNNVQRPMPEVVQNPAQPVAPEAMPKAVAAPQPVIEKPVETVARIEQPVIEKPVELEAEEPFEIHASNVPVKDTSLENKIGRNVMAILASTLIFVGIILFSIVLIPKLGDVAKQTAFFVLGAAFIGGGAFLRAKKKGGGFSTVLFALGYGELLVTLMVCRLVFGSFNDLILLLGILIWAATLIFMKKVSTTLFHIIGQVGITVCTFFGVSLCFEKNNPLFIIIVFFVLGEVIFRLAFIRKEKIADRIIFHSFVMTGTLVLSTAALFADGIEATDILGFTLSTELSMAINFVVLWVCSVLLLIDSFASRYLVDERGIFTGITSMIYAPLYDILIMVAVSKFSDAFGLSLSLPWIFLIGVCAMIPVFLFAEFNQKDKIGRFFSELACILSVFVSMIIVANAPAEEMSKLLFEVGFPCLLMIMLALLGYMRKNNLLKILALVNAVVFGALCSNIIISAVAIIVFAVEFIVLLYVYKEDYNRFYKLGIYSAMMIYIIEFWTGIPKNTEFGYYTTLYCILSLAVVNILCYYLPFSKDCEKKEDLPFLFEGMAGILIFALAIIESFAALNFVDRVVEQGLSTVLLLLTICWCYSKKYMSGFFMIAYMILTFFTISFTMQKPGFMLARNLLAAILFITLMYVKKEVYSKGFKITVYLMALAHIFRFFATWDLFEPSEDFLLASAAVALVNIIAYYLPVKKDCNGNVDIKCTFEIVAGVIIFAVAIGEPFVELNGTAAIILQIGTCVLLMITILWGVLNEHRIGWFLVPYMAITLFTSSVFSVDHVFILVRNLLVAVFFITLIYVKKESYSKLGKIFVYLMALLHIFEFFTNLEPFTKTESLLLGCAAVAIINIIAYYLPIKKDCNGEVDIRYMFEIVSGVILFTVAVFEPFAHIGEIEMTILQVATCVLLLVTIWWCFSKEFKIGWFLVPYMFLTLFTGEDPGFLLARNLMAAALFTMLMYVQKEAYSLLGKLFVYLMAMVHIFKFFISLDGMETVDGIVAASAIMAVVNICLIYTPWSRNAKTEEKDTTIFGLIINYVLSVVMLGCTFLAEELFMYIAGIASFALTFVGVDVIYDEDNKGANAFVMIHAIFMTILSMIICQCWFDHGYIASVVGILICLCFIIYGFASSKKGLRIYGLIAVMILIFKLTLIDVAHTSLIGYGISFIISGFICLAISMLYYFVNSNYGDRT